MPQKQKIKVLMANYYDRNLIGRSLVPLRKIADIIDYNRHRSLTLEEICQAIPGVHAVIAAEEPYNKQVFDRATELFLIARDGAGYDKIDLRAATDYGIVVTRAPVVMEATANMTIGLMIALIRKIPMADRAVRSGMFTKRSLFLCPDVAGMTLGILGFGQVGQKVAARAHAMGMKLITYDCMDVSRAAGETGVEIVSLNELLVRSDVVSVHLRSTPETRYFCNIELFKKMKPGAYFINTSRGRIVNEHDLVSALKSGHLAGAALDVFEQEPIDTGNPLLSMDSVILTPHVAGDTTTTMIDAANMNVTQITDMLSGHKPGNILNPEVWEHARIHKFIRGD